MELVFGPPITEFVRRAKEGIIPQLADTPEHAATLMSYGQFEGEVTRLRVSIHNAATNETVKDMAKDLNLSYDWNEMSPAQAVATDDGLRKALIAGGRCDGYIDTSVVENGEMRIVIPFFLARIEDRGLATEDDHEVGARVDDAAEEGAEGG